MIHLEKIKYHFNKEMVLRDVSLDIPKGELFGLLGPSGSGKTTLVKCMMGIFSPASGTIVIDNQTIPSFNVLEKIGYMAQADALYKELTAWQNLDFFASIYKIPRHKREARIKEAASIVNLTDQLSKPLEDYSGGMKRRMSLAVALLNRPTLLILDEPTVGIDPVLRESIWQDLKEMQSQGTTIVITTHVMDEAAKCDQLGLLRDGYVIAHGSPEELVKQSGTDTLEAAFLYYGTYLADEHRR